MVQYGPKALQEKQHSEQLRHIFLSFLFISILSKSRTKVCINGEKKAKALSLTSYNARTHTHSIFSKAVSCGFFPGTHFRLKCLWWQRLRGNVPSYKSYKSYMLLNSLSGLVFCTSGWWHSFLHRRIHVLSARFLYFGNIPTNTVKTQMPPTTFIAKVGCVRVGWEAWDRGEGCPGSQAQRWTKAEMPVSPQRNRGALREGHFS